VFKLHTEPNWRNAAQFLVSGFTSLSSREDRVRLLCQICTDLGDELYPAFIEILCIIYRLADKPSQQLTTDTLIHALLTARIPSGSIPAWGNQQSLQKRSLGPIEFLCAWYAQPCGRVPLPVNAFHAACTSLLELISTNSEAKALYCEKLILDVDESIDGSLSNASRAAILSLAKCWNASTDSAKAVDAFIESLQGDSLSRLTTFR
jgi:hypothetical protein